MDDTLPSFNSEGISLMKRLVIRENFPDKHVEFIVDRMEKSGVLFVTYDGIGKLTEKGGAERPPLDTIPGVKEAALIDDDRVVIVPEEGADTLSLLSGVARQLAIPRR